MNFSIEWLGFAGTVLCMVAYMPQVTQLIKKRCVDGLSTGAYCTWGIAGMFLLCYAITLKDPVFIALQTYQVGATVLIWYYCIKYKGHSCEEHGGTSST